MGYQIGGLSKRDDISITADISKPLGGPPARGVSIWSPHHMVDWTTVNHDVER